VLQPILVDHTGRDGSTLMMRLLRTSPAIAVPGPYPYEKKYFAYLWRWSRMLERRDKSASWTSFDLASLIYEDMKPLIGPPPWKSDLIHDQAESMSRHMFDEAWAELSRRAAEQVRAEHGDPGADVRYYAEKHRDVRLVDLAELPPVRVLVLIRDPRDMFVSFRSFDVKRTSEGGQQFAAARPAPGETEVEHVSRFIERERERMRWVAGLEPGGELPVFRYEDLVTDLPGQAGRLEEWLSARLDPAVAAADADLVARHVSASTPEASVGRWQRELEPDLVARFNRELGAELEALGYPTAAPDPSRTPG
jgi:hypothetical protein